MQQIRPRRIRAPACVIDSDRPIALKHELVADCDDGMLKKGLIEPVSGLRVDRTAQINSGDLGASVSRPGPNRKRRSLQGRLPPQPSLLAEYQRPPMLQKISFLWRHTLAA
jgi:hypothetical protein